MFTHDFNQNTFLQEGWNNIGILKGKKININILTLF